MESFMYSSLALSKRKSNLSSYNRAVLWLAGWLTCWAAFCKLSSGSLLLFKNSRNLFSFGGGSFLRWGLGAWYSILWKTLQFNQRLSMENAARWPTLTYQQMEKTGQKVRLIDWGAKLLDWWFTSLDWTGSLDWTAWSKYHTNCPFDWAIWPKRAALIELDRMNKSDWLCTSLWEFVSGIYGQNPFSFEECPKESTKPRVWKRLNQISRLKMLKISFPGHCMFWRWQ
jgi:hypothetical protein